MSEPSFFKKTLRFFGVDRKAGTSLESKVKQLANFGFVLAEPFTIDDLLSSWDESAFEQSGYNLVLVALGSTEEQPPWRPRCENLWHFDTECIEDHGSYVAIAERMKAISGGSLPIENIRDDVDLEAERATLAFDYNGKTIDISCKVDNDWVDPDVFRHFIRVLAESDPTKVYAYYDLGGQDCIIACVTRDNLARLRKSGIAFEALSDMPA
jgi:hypothetical protein